MTIDPNILNNLFEAPPPPPPRVEQLIRRVSKSSVYWKLLLDSIDFDPNKALIIFRGQSINSWKIESSLQRTTKNYDTDDEREKAAFEIQEFTTQSFKQEAKLHLPFHISIDTNHSLSLLPLMQHYGVPTRIIDWTRSPYVATYFAVNENEDVDGALYCCNALPFKSGNLSDAPISAFVPHLQSNLTINQTDRQISQQSCYVDTNKVHQDHWEIMKSKVREYFEQKNWPLLGDLAYQKIIIAKEIKQEIRKQLIYMNVTAKTLFPGIEGLGRSIAEEARMYSISNQKK